MILLYGESGKNQGNDEDERQKIEDRLERVSFKEKYRPKRVWGK